MPARTDPASASAIIREVSPLPSTGTEHSILGVRHQSVDSPVLEGSVWVERLRVGIGVRDRSGPYGDWVSSANVVFRSPVLHGERKR